MFCTSQDQLRNLFYFEIGVVADIENTKIMHKSFFLFNFFSQLRFKPLFQISVANTQRAPDTPDIPDTVGYWHLYYTLFCTKLSFKSRKNIRKGSWTLFENLIEFCSNLDRTIEISDGVIVHNFKQHSKLTWKKQIWYLYRQTFTFVGNFFNFLMSS